MSDNKEQKNNNATNNKNNSTQNTENNDYSTYSEQYSNLNSDVFSEKYANHPNLNKIPEATISPEDEEFLRFAKGGLGGYYRYPVLLNQIIKDLSTAPRKYKREEVIKWLSNPAYAERQLRELNQYLFNESNYYRRLSRYLSTMPTFDAYLKPKLTKDIKKSAFNLNYQKVLKWLDKFDIKSEFTKLMPFLINEDVAFTYLRESNDVATFQILPANYCKIVNKNHIGFEYAFDMNFFRRNIVDLNIDNYPTEIVEAYHEMLDGKLYNNWVFLDPEKAVCFKFNDETAVITPSLMGVFLDALSISDYKDLEKTRTALDTIEIVVQKIPMSSGNQAKKNEFLLDLDKAGFFHDELKNALPQGYVGFTTPMAIEKLTTDKGQTRQDLVPKGENNFYSSGGVNKTLFNGGDSAIAMERSLQTDEAYVLKIYRQFERWLKYQLYKLTGVYNFEIKFPDISYYNREKKSEMYLTAAQNGFPTKYQYAASIGMDIGELDSMQSFEEITGISERLRPLQTSYTMTDEGKGNGSKGGAPEQDIKDLTPNSAKQRVEGTNKTRGLVK